MRLPQEEDISNIPQGRSPFVLIPDIEKWLITEGIKNVTEREYLWILVFLFYLHNLKYQWYLKR